MVSKKDFKETKLRMGLEEEKESCRWKKKKKNSWIHVQWKNAHKFEGKRPEANIWKDNDSHETNH